MLGQIFAQTYNFTKVINKFGSKLLDYVLAEVKQLHDRTCSRRMYLNKITSQELKRAMELFIFLTVKLDGRIKVQACANGIIHQYWMNKE